MKSVVKTAGWAPGFGVQDSILAARKVDDCLDELVQLPVIDLGESLPRTGAREDGLLRWLLQADVWEEGPARKLAVGLDDLEGFVDLGDAERVEGSGRDGRRVTGDRQRSNRAANSRHDGRGRQSRTAATSTPTRLRRSAGSLKVDIGALLNACTPTR